MRRCVISSVKAFSRQNLRSAIMLVLCIICGCAPSMPAHAESEYKLAPGDRISIVVFGNNELSGTFEIDGTGSISYPVIGSIDLGGINLTQAEQRLTNSLNGGILVNPSVFIRVAELRPVQVIGDVRTSGSFPYRSGSIVKSAVALAGGYGTSLLSPGSAAAEFLTADERLKVLQSNEWRLQLRHARLAAQLKQESQFDSSFVKNVPEAEVSTAVAEELQHLNDQIGARNRKVELLRSQRAPMAAENEAIDSQIANERKQLDIIQTQIKSYEKLQKSGLARFDTMIQMQLNAATKESMIGRLEGEKSRLRSSIGELEIRLQDAENEFTKQTSADMLDVSQRLSEIAIALPLAQGVRSARLREASGSAALSMKRQFFISRVTNGEAKTFAVSETDPIEPGDIIEVRVEVSELKTTADAAHERTELTR